MLTTPPQGLVRAHRIGPAGAAAVSDWRPNTVLYGWATAITHLLATGDPKYRLSTFYLEFENVTSAGNTVSAPTFGRADGIGYYNGLSTSGDRDYLRVPVIGHQIDSTDDQKFPDGNRVTFYAQSTGSQGVHGRPFDAANNSTVFGGALVATPDPDDASQDIVFARFYLDAADQQVKLSTSQIGLEWALPFQ